MTDWHLKTLGKEQFAECVRKAMRSTGMVEWLRAYERKFPWPRRPFTMPEYRRRKRVNP